MRVAILAFGTRGDVQPFVALGLGLRDAGHEVHLVIPADFYELTAAYGLECTPITIEVRHRQHGNVKTGRLPPHVMYRLAQKYMRQALVEIWEAVTGTESLIFSDWGRIPGIHIVEKLGIPAFMGLTHPQQMRFLYRETHVFGGSRSLLSSRIRKRVLWQLVLKRLINAWRKDTLGLPTTTFWGSEGQLKRRGIPLFFAHSPTVFPKPRNWPETFHVTGYWFLDRLHTWQAPAALVDFLASGSPLVYVGFSSMSNGKIAKMAPLILEALAITKQRAILGSGWSKLGKSITLPDNVIAIDAVPHDWLFPQVAAVVHHGGAGTTAMAFRAGVPNIIIPFGLDQPFWAWRVAALGAGPRAIPPRRLSAARLAQAIDSAVHNVDIKARCAALGECVRGEDGVGHAVELFQHYIST